MRSCGTAPALAADLVATAAARRQLSWEHRSVNTLSLTLSVMAFLVAAASALFARQQVSVAQSASRVQSILTLVDYLQRSDIRDARRVVLTELTGKPAPTWTEEQRGIASSVAASYDLVGTLLRTGVVDGHLILQSYGASIIRCHEACSPMVDAFREGMPDALARSYWDDFDWLSDQAQAVLGHSGPVSGSGRQSS